MRTTAGSPALVSGGSAGPGRRPPHTCPCSFLPSLLPSLLHRRSHLHPTPPAMGREEGEEGFTEPHMRGSAMIPADPQGPPAPAPQAMEEGVGLRPLRALGRW